MAESESSNVRKRLHASLRQACRDSTAAVAGQTNYKATILAVLDLVNDLQYPINPGEPLVVSRPSDISKTLLDHVNLTICTLQDYHAELFRQAFNKGKVLNNDDQTLVTKIYTSHHLTSQEALDAVRPRTSRGRPKSTSGTAKSSKPRAAKSNPSLMSPASRK